MSSSLLKAGHTKLRDFQGSPVVKSSPFNAGVWVQSLVEKLGSHMPRGQTTNIKQKQYWSKLNKDFKNGPHKKKSSKKLRNTTPVLKYFSP